MNAPWRLLLLILIVQFFPANLQAADLIMPQGRRAYYSEEPIELAVAGLAKDKGTLELIPKGKAFPVILDIQGNGSTVTLVLPKWTLAPGEYTVKLNGKNAGNLTISSGVVDSTLLLSQTINHQQLKEAGANFIVSNAFNYGNFSPDHTGPRIKNLRQSKSRGLLLFEQAIAMNLLSVVYMYWTGYVTHKPFGSKKSWADKKMTQAMRLLSFHTAQRLRRFRKNIVSVGTIDEPGLGWGKTPAGHTASGFPDWDEKDWYQARGWKYTNDPASRSAQDWMKYMTIRCGIIKEQQAQARKDLTTVWPEMVFSTDLYAPHAIMDGTDPLSQVVNDIPASHVFADWGSDRLGVYSGIKLENAHDPTARLAHAMNGQLFAKRVPQPNQLHAYRVCLNGMLAAGIKSNWWLNTGGMSPKELAAVNNPAKRIGPMLQEADLNDHDTAVLWSFTEIAMREKSLTAKEAHKKPGEKILVTVKDLPEHGPIKSRELSINAYSIGSDYRDGVMLAHYALSRAGYPAHIVHERILPKGILKNYKTLVIIGQTFALPPEIRKEIRQFQAAGGKIVVDKSTTVSFKDAIVAPFDFSGLSYRWNALFTLEENKFKSKRHDSYYQCNHFMDEPVRQAVAPLKKTMAKTNSQPRLETDSTELVVERHKAEEGSIYMVINGYE